MKNTRSYLLKISMPELVEKVLRFGKEHDDLLSTKPEFSLEQKKEEFNRFQVGIVINYKELEFRRSFDAPVSKPVPKSLQIAEAFRGRPDASTTRLEIDFSLQDTINGAQVTASGRYVLGLVNQAYNFVSHLAEEYA